MQFYIESYRGVLHSFLYSCAIICLMQFNPTDKSLSLIGDIDFLLFSDSSTLNTEYSLVDRTRNINIAYDEVITEIFKADPNYKWDDTTNTDFPIATTTLTAGLDHYSMPDSSLIVHRVRVKDNNGNYVTLVPKNRAELTDTELNSTGGVPDKYYKVGAAIFPLPVPDYGYAAGVELEFQRGSNHFRTSDTTAEPGFNPQFHQILSIKAALRYALANGMKEKSQMLRDMLHNNNRDGLMDKLLEHYQLRSPDEKPKFKLKRSSRSYGL